MEQQAVDVDHLLVARLELAERLEELTPSEGLPPRARLVALLARNAGCPAGRDEVGDGRDSRLVSLPDVDVPQEREPAAGPQHPR